MDPGTVGLTADDLGPLPDEIISDPDAGRLDPRVWFPLRERAADRPFEIEIGSGKGTFLVQQAGLQPETDFLGIEWAGEFFRYAADRVRRQRMENVRLLHADATEFLRWRCPPGIARVVHLYFSDPWPKTKHHKNRVIQDRFLADVRRVLIPGGELRVVTDHQALWEWDRAHFDRWCDATANQSGTPGYSGPAPAFTEHRFEAPESADQGELVGTNFERKFRVEGRHFFSTVLRKPLDR
ncbi:MAG: hypothetical protein AAGB51_08115 [Planctomycetota bacterium]